MFTKNSGGLGQKEGVETIIGSSVKLEGNFSCQGGIVVEGEVKGNLKTSSLLDVGVKAVVTADIEAAEARVAGEIKGNLRVSGFLEIASSAKIYGDIEASSISVGQGAVLKGKILVLGNESKNHKSKEKEDIKEGDE